MHRKKLHFLIAVCAAAMLFTGCSEPADRPGRVYYLNFKEEQDGDWKALADLYTRQTGVEVSVVTASSGTYQDTLATEMAKSDQPTLFQVNGPIGLADWKDCCYDLTDSALAGELTDDAYRLEDDGATLGIAFVVETYGIIVNKPLLARAGYAPQDIRSFKDLKAVAEDITARRDELGFAAFTSAGLDRSSDWRFKTHLANMPLYFEYRDRGVSSANVIRGSYLECYHQVIDLYLQNATCDPRELADKTGEDSRREFLNGEAVFYQNGSWEYNNLVGEGKFRDDELTILPLYIGAGNQARQGLCTGTENYWCVNSQMPEQDIQATLDFLYWCVTSDDGTQALADMGFVVPFKQAKPTANIFLAEDARLTAEGRSPVPWVFSTMPSEAWKNGVGAALADYAAGSGSWQAVRTAFVDGWAAGYAEKS